MDSSVADIVIDRFGGLTKLALALGHKNPSTVQGWRRSGDIPQKQWLAVSRAAQEAGFHEITLLWLGQMHAMQEGARAAAAGREPDSDKTTKCGAV